MKRSVDRLLTTHTGSLPRPPGLRAAESDALRTAVRDVVRLQVAAGIDIVSDGEMSKPSYATYIADRAEGFGGRGNPRLRIPEAGEFRDYGEALAARTLPTLPACIGEIHASDRGAVERDIANLKEAVEDAGANDAFLTAASPGVIPMFVENQYYASDDAYLEALTSVMQGEYEAIHSSGLTLRIDCPDLALGRHHEYSELDLDAWKAIIRGHVEAVNAATAAIPPDAMRLHLCWGNYPGPHTHDVPLSEILDIVLQARPAAISFEAANPRHAHEWTVWQNVKLPDDKVLIPGVIDSTTNYVEHPELVAQRLLQFATIVGRERVIAGTDCGFGTIAEASFVFPSIAYAKLRALAEGAEIASRKLW